MSQLTPRKIGYLRETAIVFGYEFAAIWRSVRPLSLLAVYLIGSLLAAGVFCRLYKAADEKGMRPEDSKKVIASLLYSSVKDPVDQEVVMVQFDDEPVSANAPTKTPSPSLSARQDKAVSDVIKFTPLPMLFVFWMGVLVTPLFSVLMGFDLLSGDLQHRFVRYLAPRLRPGPMLIGKILSQVAIQVLISLFTGLIILSIFLWQLKGLDPAGALLATCRFWILSLPYMATYVALAAFLSSLSRTPLLSLLCQLVAIFCLWCLAGLASFEKFAYIDYFLPSYYKFGLYSPDPSYYLTSFGVYTLFASFFTALAWLVTTRRDR
jgi:ABC-type transport system involved in multi-copper enzyme maturation permease subunit